MCKKTKCMRKGIDPCMKNLIDFIDATKSYKTLACCCGHRKYNMSIVVTNGEICWDLMSNKIIPRKKRFYRKDKQGYYYIPECVKPRQEEQ